MFAPGAGKQARLGLCGPSQLYFPLMLWDVFQCWLWFSQEPEFLNADKSSFLEEAGERKLNRKMD